jgi:hypothetical protein
MIGTFLFVPKLLGQRRTGSTQMRPDCFLAARQHCSGVFDRTIFNQYERSDLGLAGRERADRCPHFRRRPGPDRFGRTLSSEP